MAIDELNSIPLELIKTITMKSIYHFIITAFILTCSVSHAQYTTLHSFDGALNGTYGSESLYSDGTFLYGMTDYGGANNLGTLYKINQDGTGFVKLLDFNGTTNGSLPKGSLISDGTYLYGMTSNGGTGDLGTVFKIMPDGTGYIKLLDFAGTTNGSYPNSTLFFDGTFLYGMTASGGTNGLGTIFKLMPDGTGYVSLMDFAGSTNGQFPEGPLISDGTFLYGVTPAGGTANLGVIFKIMPDGTGYVKLRNFAGGNLGSTPRQSFVSDGTFLYGMTTYGGSNNQGIIYKVMPDGSGFSKIFDFTGGTDGIIPVSNLVYDGNYLFGMTNAGGINDFGTIFRILPDGNNYEKLFDFDGLTNGSNPVGALLIDGTVMYGITQFGGTNDVGVIFKYDKPVGLTETTLEPDFTVSPNPSSGLVTLSTTFTGETPIIVTNIIGDIIHSEELKLSSSSKVIIDLSKQKNGVYLVKVGNVTKRLIID
ncbi:MAG: putative repeat protein (TIGR03803 family) [Saprospiraceae bacterium]